MHVLPDLYVKNLNARVELCNAQPQNRELILDSSVIHG